MMKSLRLTALLAVVAFSGVAIAQPLASQPAGGPSSRLLHDFASAENLRAFAYQAKARSSEGGLFYAEYVANLCGREYSKVVQRGNAMLGKQLQAVGTLPAWQLAAAADLPRRCSAFVEGEAATLRNQVTGLAASDPLKAAEKDLRSALKSGRRDQLKSAVAHAMDLDDPLLWTSRRLWDAVAQSDPEAKKVLGFYMDGSVYSEKDGLKHLEAYTALELGFCKVGLPCALDDELRIVCASGGACAPDRESKARSYYLANGGTEDGWKRVLLRVDQVRSAIASRNVAFFVR